MSVTGSWLNGYGSVMFLTQGDGGSVTGTYTSTTGSSGSYWVTGFTGSAASQSTGQPLAFSILWRSFANGEPDPSWHWVSGFSGQMLPLDPVNNGPTLILFNDLVATVADPVMTSVPGSYIDKLAYVPYTGGQANPGQWPPPFTPPSYPDPIDGAWQCIENPAISLFLQVEDVTSGYVAGTLTTGAGTSVVVGFTDNGAGSAGLLLQGLTLSAVLPDGQTVVALAGDLVLSAGTLTMEWVHSVGTAPDVSYMQTNIEGMNFGRA
ncbi:MAG TPA: avidin/streptavidin family protein [Thermoanaerobaculia bacterium]|nr:avidin/streptavidin family protein [Thermoanaerobaculia bacterium]